MELQVRAGVGDRGQAPERVYLVGSCAILEKFYISNSVVSTVDAIFPPRAEGVDAIFPPRAEGVGVGGQGGVVTTAGAAGGSGVGVGVGGRGELVFQVLDLTEQFVQDL